MRNFVSIQKSNILKFSAQKEGVGKATRVEIFESCGARPHKKDRMKFLLELKHEVRIYGKGREGDGEEAVLARINLVVEHYCDGVEIKDNENSEREISILKDRLIPYSVSKVNSMLTDIGLSQVPMDAFYKSAPGVK